MKSTPEVITSLSRNQIFVFGSNLGGFHGAGAARKAYHSFGAEWGVGEGRTGQCYAIPTKDAELGIRPLEAIDRSVERFLSYAQRNPELTFLVTKIGCGLAGYSTEAIKPMFKNRHVPGNVVLPIEFQ